MRKATHTKAEQFRLFKHIEANYTKSGDNDCVFAKAATIELGFQVNDRHVWGARQSLGIEPNNKKFGLRPNKDLAKRVEKIETALMALYAQLGWYPPKDQ